LRGARPDVLRSSPRAATRRTAAVFQPHRLPPATRSFVAVAALLGACSEGEPAAVRAARAAERAAPRAAPPPDVTLPGVAPVPGGYAARAVVGGGRVAGVVTLAGEPPRDTTITPDPALARACGATLLDRALAGRGQFVDGAVVWLVGVREGKASAAPMRQTLTLDRCQLTPRAAAVPAGATLNVKGRDPLSLRLRAVAWPGGETRAAWRLTDAGQVVPDDRVLADAGALEVRGESLPWVRAWLLVFDHPYHATTDGAGAFALDSVPPGDYRIVAWHPRVGRVEQPVTVTSGGAASVSLTLSR
jgi:hypothetical protein